MAVLTVVLDKVCYLAGNRLTEQLDKLNGQVLLRLTGCNGTLRWDTVCSLTNLRAIDGRKISQLFDEPKSGDIGSCGGEKPKTNE